MASPGKQPRRWGGREGCQGRERNLQRPCRAASKPLQARPMLPAPAPTNPHQICWSSYDLLPLALALGKRMQKDKWIRDMHGSYPLWSCRTLRFSPSQRCSDHRLRHQTRSDPWFASVSAVTGCTAIGAGITAGHSARGRFPHACRQGWLSQKCLGPPLDTCNRQGKRCLGEVF